MSFKIVYLTFLSIFIVLYSGCASAKYYAPHMSKLDKTDIKTIPEEDINGGIYLNIVPIYGFTIKDDSSVEIDENSINVKAYTKQEYKNYSNDYKDTWIIYNDTNTYAIPSYTVSMVQNRRDRWCRYFSGHNVYMCNSIYFLYDESGNIIDKNVTLHAIAINKEKLNKEGALYKKWLLAGFDSFRDVGDWKAVGKSPQEAKRWIELGISARVSKNYDIDDYIYKCYEYNLSLYEVKKWVKLEIYNPHIINFLKFNNYTLESFKYKNLRQLLNTMKLDEFFRMMNIQDIRLINGYLYHWKYNTNNKRFYNILKKYYGIEYF